VQPSATPVINCLNGLSATSPAAYIPEMFVSDVLKTYLVRN